MWVMSGWVDGWVCARTQVVDDDKAIRKWSKGRVGEKGWHKGGEIEGGREGGEG